MNEHSFDRSFQNAVAASGAGCTCRSGMAYGDPEEHGQACAITALYAKWKDAGRAHWTRVKDTPPSEHTLRSHGLLPNDPGR